MTTNMTPGKKKSFQAGPVQARPVQARPAQAGPVQGVGTATKVAPARVRPTHQQIAQRAQAIWKAKGCLAGQDEQNWREAEAQLKAELGLR